VVRMRDPVVEADSIAIVAELVRGPNLRQYLGARGMLAPPPAAEGEWYEPQGSEVSSHRGNDPRVQLFRSGQRRPTGRHFERRQQPLGMGAGDVLPRGANDERDAGPALCDTNGNACHPERATA
jgi:hypothetical protein